MTVEDLLGSRRRVADRPMVDGSLCDKTESRVVDPFPKDDVLVANVRLHLLLGLDVKDLECSTGWRRSQSMRQY